MSSRTRRALGLSIVTLLGCGAPAPAPAEAPRTEVTLKPAPPTASVGPTVDPALISVLLKGRPPKLAIDGVLDEWGPLAPLAAQLTKEPEQVPEVKTWFFPYRRTETSEVKARPPEQVNAQAAPSRVALALGPGGLVIAAELTGPAREGFRLGIASAIPQLPPVGNTSGPGGNVDGFNCKGQVVPGSDGAMLEGAPLAPSDAAACRAQEARDWGFEQAHAADFERMFVINPSGVFVEQPDGRLRRVGYSKEVWTGERGPVARLEVELPLHVLPYVSQTPIEAMRFVARAVSQTAIAHDEWVWLSFPAPIELEPEAELRSLAYRPEPRIEFRDKDDEAGRFYPPCLSYHPASPDRIRFIRHEDDTSRLALHDVMLYERLAVVGETEVGRLNAPQPFLAIRRRGKPTKLLTPMGGNLDLFKPFEVRYVGKRGEDHHLVAFVPQNGFTGATPTPPKWWIVIVHPDGSYEQQLLDPVELVRDRMSFFYYTEHKEVANADATRLEITGVPFADLPPGTGLSALWVWDAAKKTYKGTARDTKAPAKKKTAPDSDLSTRR